MRVVKLFSYQKEAGIRAENYLIEKFFPSLGLVFEKIPKNEGNTPDGWILDDGQKIALAEIKLIRHEKETKHQLSSGAIGVHLIEIDKTIQSRISSAKKQLKTVETNLPKILYLVLDDSFADSRSVLDAAFGPWVTVTRISGQTIYNGPRGFHPTEKMKQDNKILGDWVSAIFCYLHDTDGYKLLLFRRAEGKILPTKLMPTEAIEEIWEYSETSIVRKR